MLIIYPDIEFSYFSKNSECILRTEFPLFNAHVSGGKLISLSSDKIGLSTGDFRRWEKAQDDNSYFGKILSISLDDGSYEIISKGHKNPQGLAKTLKILIFLLKPNMDRGWW